MGIRLNKILKQLNVSTETVVEYLKSKPGLEPVKEMNPNTKVTDEQYAALLREFHGDKLIKERADSIFPVTSKEHKPSLRITNGQGGDDKVAGKSDIDATSQSTRPTKKTKEEREAERRAKRAEWMSKTNSSLTEDNITLTDIVDKKTIDENTSQKKLKIFLSELTFVKDCMTFTTHGESFSFVYEGLRPYMNSYRENPLLEATYIEITLDYKNHTFYFEDYSAFNVLHRFLAVVDADMTRKRKELDSKIGENVVPSANNDRNTRQESVGVQEKSVIKSAEGNTQKPYQITLSQLRFEEGCITYKKGTNTFIFRHLGFSSDFNKLKNDSRIKDVTTQITLDYSKGTFDFVDKTALRKLEDFKTKVDNDMFEKHLKDVERKKAKEEKEKERKEKKIAKRQIEHRIQFSALRFGYGIISIIYKKNRYVYRDSKIRDYENVIGQVYGRLPKARKNAIKTSLVWVIIDTETGTFSFKDFDIHNYINNLKDSFLPERKNTEVRKEIPPKVETVPQKSSSALKTMTLGAGNIHFYNGYFLIFHTIKGEVDNAVTPFRVNDADSHEILNLVHNFFEQRFEQMRIMVKYDETKILEPARSDLYQLNKYVRTLKRNLDVKGEWWEEVQNARKRTFGQCFCEPTDSVKKRFVKSKNEYLYNLASFQNDRKLIRVYEINHGKEEDAFIFSINMSDNRCAIIFENASKDSSTTTWVFIAKNEDYEACVNLMFNYFTNYTTNNKRLSLRKTGANPPEMFKAEDYTFIDHNDLGQWLKKLNRILENKPQPSDIKFVPGINIPQSSDTRSGHGDAITTKNLHNELMRKLYDRLCGESGKDNVGTEIHVGAKRIDAVVKGSDFYDLYEVKTALNPFDCVTEALGQLCQYAYLFCRDKIGKMVIAGASEPTREVEQYLATLRKNHSLQVYYIKV
jgi:hypothetical protein